MALHDTVRELQMDLEEMNGKAYLVGAGPGRADLITIRGLALLREADVVLYDRLIPRALLDEAPGHAEMIFVGKRPGHHPTPQPEINRLLQKYVGEGKQVVRLKGGDPFVMGRGGEEALALAEMGLNVEFVPGVTSALAVPAYAGIPVSQKDMAESFAVVTGFEDPTKPYQANDWPGLAHIDTLIILMATRRSGEVCKKLIREGRDPHTPAVAVSRGTTDEQRIVTATLATLGDTIRAAKLATPAMLIIGHATKMAEKIGWFKPEQEDAPIVGTLRLDGENGSASRTRAVDSLSTATLPTGRVYLVGAGPGDPALITLRGREAIAQADVILHDRLVSPELLSHARADTTIINVGKAPSRNRFSQEEINKLLTSYGTQAVQNKSIVVRLKGGDPFVYGLGGDECLVLRDEQIPYEVVPGVSSITAVPASAGIPVTHRTLASGFTVLSAHSVGRDSSGNAGSNDQISGIPWADLPQTGTLLILMGVRKLPFIVDGLLSSGRDPNLPVAIIESGTTEAGSVVQSTLGQLQAQLTNNEISCSPPALIVIGDVVLLRQQMGKLTEKATDTEVWGVARELEVEAPR